MPIPDTNGRIDRKIRQEGVEHADNEEGNGSRDGKVDPHLILMHAVEAGLSSADDANH